MVKHLQFFYSVIVKLMNQWINEEANKIALSLFNFSDIVCGTAQGSGQLIAPLRSETCQQLWKFNTNHMLETPHSIEATMNLFKQM